MLKEKKYLEKRILRYKYEGEEKIKAIGGYVYEKKSSEKKSI